VLVSQGAGLQLAAVAIAAAVVLSVCGGLGLALGAVLAMLRRHRSLALARCMIAPKEILVIRRLAAASASARHRLSSEASQPLQSGAAASGRRRTSSDAQPGGVAGRRRVSSEAPPPGGAAAWPRASLAGGPALHLPDSPHGAQSSVGSNISTPFARPRLCLVLTPDGTLSLEDIQDVDLSTLAHLEYRRAPAAFSQFTVHCSLFTVHAVHAVHGAPWRTWSTGAPAFSQLTVHSSQFTVHCSQCTQCTEQIL
jgi:hypothetical protein